MVCMRIADWMVKFRTSGDPTAGARAKIAKNKADAEAARKEKNAKV